MKTASGKMQISRHIVAILTFCQSYAVTWQIQRVSWTYEAISPFAELLWSLLLLHVDR